MGGVGGEGGSVFSGAAGDRGLLAGCAGHGGGSRGGRSFSGGGGAVGPTRWVTRAVTVPVQLAACAVRPPICAGRKGSPRPGLLDRLRNPGSLPLHQSGIAPLFRLVFLPQEWEKAGGGKSSSPSHMLSPPPSARKCPFLQKKGPTGLYFSSPSRAPRDLCAYPLSTAGSKEWGYKIFRTINKNTTTNKILV